MEARANRPHGTAAALALALGLAVVIGAAGATAPARAATAPVITAGPTIEGTAQEGATLTARAAWTGDPAPSVVWLWARCQPLGSPCTTIAGAATPNHTVTAADVGSVIVVRLTVSNDAGSLERQAPATAVVTAAPAPGPAPSAGPAAAPAPGPALTPSAYLDPPAPKPAGTLPSPPGDDNARTTAFDLSSLPVPAAPVGAKQKSKATRAPVLSPFPIIRIKGSLTADGARLTLFTITVPRNVRVKVLCNGIGCPLRHLGRVARSATTMHLRAFERELRRGTRLEISITRPGYVGKSSVIVIQRGRAPTRRDLCLVPGRTGPAPCPAS